MGFRILQYSKYLLCTVVEDIPVTGRGDPYRCETSRLPHFLENWLNVGGEVVSFRRGPPFIPGRILVVISVRG
jgi:hypothetical protein